MTKIIIENYLLDPVLAAIINAQTNSGRIDGLTQLKLNKLKRAIHPVWKDYTDVLPDLKDTHIKKDKSGDFKTKPENGQKVFVFKSEKDETKFKQVSGAENTIEVPYLLRESDLLQLKLTGQELDALMLVVEGEARIPEPAKNGKDKQPA